MTISTQTLAQEKFESNMVLNQIAFFFSEAIGYCEENGLPAISDVRRDPFIKAFSKAWKLSNLTIFQFCDQCLLQDIWTTPILISAFCLVQKVQSKLNFTVLTQQYLPKLFAVCVFISQKLTLDDGRIKICDMASVIDVSISDLKEMELVVLELLSFNCFIEEELYNKSKAIVHSYYFGEEILQESSSRETVLDLCLKAKFFPKVSSASSKSFDSFSETDSSPQVSPSATPKTRAAFFKIRSVFFQK